MLGIGIGINKAQQTVDPAIALINDGNTAAWYDYTYGVTADGSNVVSKWANKMGVTARDLPNTGTPHLTADGILFDGTGDAMKVGFTLVQPESLYIVARQKTYTSGDILLDGYNAFSAYINQTAGAGFIRTYAGSYSGLTSDWTMDTFMILRMVFNGATSKLQVANNAAVTGNFGANNMGGITVGAYAGLSIFGHVEYKEIIVRNVDDSDANEKILYNYLAGKYGFATI